MFQVMQDAIWSTSVQFGAGSEKKGDGAIGMFKKAFAGKDYNSMSDEERIKTLQDYKLANNEKLFASSSANVRAGTAKRAVDEKNILLAMAGKSASSPTPDASANKSASSATQKSEATSSQPVSPSSRMPSPVAATPTVSTPPAPSTPPKMASTATVPDAKVEPPAPVAVAASSGGASGMAAQGVSQHLSNPTIAHIVTGGIGFRG